jgi:hypothetical protein
VKWHYIATLTVEERAVGDMFGDLKVIESGIANICW